MLAWLSSQRFEKDTPNTPLAERIDLCPADFRRDPTLFEFIEKEQDSPTYQKIVLNGFNFQHPELTRLLDLVSDRCVFYVTTFTPKQLQHLMNEEFNLASSRFIIAGDPENERFSLKTLAMFATHPECYHLFDTEGLTFFLTQGSLSLSISPAEALERCYSAENTPRFCRSGKAGFHAQLIATLENHRLSKALATHLQEGRCGIGEEFLLTCYCLYHHGREMIAKRICRALGLEPTQFWPTATNTTETNTLAF